MKLLDRCGNTSLGVPSRTCGQTSTESCARVYPHPQLLGTKTGGLGFRVLGF